MNRIHTAILALVLGIFLIQAADPPYEASTGNFLQFYPFRASKKLASTSPSNGLSEQKTKESIPVEDSENTKTITDRQFLSAYLQPPPPQIGEIFQGRQPFLGNFRDQEFLEQSFVPDFLVPPTQGIADRPTSHLPLNTFFKPSQASDLDQIALPDGVRDLQEVSSNALPLYPPIYQVSNQVFDSGKPDNQSFFKNRYPTDESLNGLHNYLKQVNSDSPKQLPDISQPNDVQESLQQEKTPYQELMEKDFIKPLLKLYEKEIHQEPRFSLKNGSQPNRISKEDYVGNFKVMSKDELDFVMQGIEKIDMKEFTGLKADQQLEKKQEIGAKLLEELEELKRQYLSQKNSMDKRKNNNKTNNDSVPEGKTQIVSSSNDVLDLKKVRRDDISPLENRDQEHIGEILPIDFNGNIERLQTNKPHTGEKLNPLLYGSSSYQMRKSYEFDERSKLPLIVERSELPRIPLVFPGERYFEPTGDSPDYVDGAGYSSDNFKKVKSHETNIPGGEQIYLRSPRLSLSQLETYRTPRRFRGFRDPYADGFQPYFDPSARYQTAWSSRRPRVIFPSDQVSFRDQVQNPSQEQEPEWLAGDNALQDLQEPDVRDRGSQDFCAPGATCEFFLSCWLSGGLLDQPCDGLLRGCCFRGGVAKKGQSGGQAVGTLEAPPETGKSQKGLLDAVRCGISTPRQAQRRIVGGEEAGFGTFPWQAYIRIGSSRICTIRNEITNDAERLLTDYGPEIIDRCNIIDWCGGSLVSRRHVVTAGHCVARAAPRQVHVTLGDYVINSAVEPLPAYTFGVSTIQVHPFFKFTPQADRFDVAVLRLDRAANNLPHITPICLPPRGENFLGEVGVAAGWGALSPGSRLRPQTLQAVQVPVIENRQCERWHRSKGISVTIYDEMMCAGYKTGGRDSCQGDSGGPLMLQRTGRWFLIGIVSAGYSCAQPGQPGIYHRVAHTVDWITRAIGS